jgi:hypothetical protein
MTRRSTFRPFVDVSKLIALGKQTINFLPEAAVRDAWRDAASRCSIVPDSVAGTVTTIADAVESVATAGRETLAAWRRHGRTPA